MSQKSKKIDNLSLIRKAHSLQRGYFNQRGKNMPDYSITLNNIYLNIPKIPIEEENLYKSIEDTKLKYVFSYFQYRINYLLRQLMNKKGEHYKAQDSKELLDIIDKEKRLMAALTGTKFSYSINSNYKTLLDKSRDFLTTSYGCEVPDDIPVFEISWDKPIFELQQTIELETLKHAPLTELGSGSYATVYSYEDKNYNTIFALKRANKDLTEKELERFKTEFETMKSLNSPYIVKVYKYNDDKNEYSMEYADQTLEEFLRHNPTLDKNSRKKLVKQILKALTYVHSKNIYHRDIATNNILIFHYEDGTFVAKISDFGLVKIPNSNITSLYTEIKGSFNDKSDLERVGFENYSMCHEIYALTKLVYFVMTGRRQYQKDNASIDQFFTRGTDADTKKRYKDVGDLEKAFENTAW